MLGFFLRSWHNNLNTKRYTAVYIFLHSFPSKQITSLAKSHSAHPYTIVSLTFNPLQTSQPTYIRQWFTTHASSLVYSLIIISSFVSTSSLILSESLHPLLIGFAAPTLWHGLPRVLSESWPWPCWKTLPLARNFEKTFTPLCHKRLKCIASMQDGWTWDTDVYDFQKQNIGNNRRLGLATKDRHTLSSHWT